MPGGRGGVGEHGKTREGWPLRGLWEADLRPDRVSWGRLGGLKGSLEGCSGARWRSRGLSLGEGLGMWVRVPPLEAIFGPSWGLLELSWAAS